MNKPCIIHLNGDHCDEHQTGVFLSARICFVGFDDGSVKFYVDSIGVQSEPGIDQDGLKRNISRSKNSLVGGGKYWVPYLYKEGQSIILWSWRYGRGFSVGPEWVKELFDKEYVSVIQQ